MAAVRAWRLGLAAPAVLLSACTADVVAPATEPPVISSSRAASDIENVLGGTLSVRVLHADSVRVQYHLANMEDIDSATPAMRVTGDSVVVPVLGLLPGSRYTLRGVAFGAGGSSVGDSVDLVTGDLPIDLPQYGVSGAAPPGYTVLAAGKYGVVIDGTGRVVWYRYFADGPGLNFMAQRGRYVARPTTPDPLDLDLWLELDPLGHVTRTFGCAGNLEPRFHDLIREADDSYWIMCDETRTLDLSAEGGNGAAQVTGTVVQHLSAAGVLLFQWNPFEHFDITDLPAPDRAGPVVNWTHGNALALGNDGTLLVSFRSLSEITKISTVTGDVLWRLGGLANQFTLEGSGPPFVGQHGVRIDDEGGLTLLDNQGTPGRSRAERYQLDEGTRAARMTAAYSSDPAVIGSLGGSVQALPGGRVLVSLGNAQRVEEFDASGAVVWKLEGGVGYVFRAQRIGSLYYPEPLAAHVISRRASP